MQKTFSISSPSGLCREKRIRKRRDFLRVQRHGVRSFGRFIVAVAKRDNDKSAGKIGITVPKKVGKAHVRNKIKRQIRHILREHQDLFSEKFLVIVARDSASSASFSELSKDILEACRKLRFKALNKPRVRFTSNKDFGAQHEYTL